jgi:hypothetical protein
MGLGVEKIQSSGTRELRILRKQDGGATSHNKNVSGSAGFARSDLHGLELSDIVSCQLNSVGLSKGARF